MKGIENLKRTSFPYLMVLPMAMSIAIVFLYPLVYAVGLSFFREESFIGLGNYIRLIHDPRFWWSMFITIIYVILYFFGVFVVGMFTALVANINFRFSNILNMIITIPYAIPDVAAALIWMWMFDYQYGVLNYVLIKIGLVDIPLLWLQNPSLALISVLIVTIWRLFPLHTLIILAAIRAVPDEQYEAAFIDGASSLQAFWYITLPGIWRILCILAVLTFVWSFKRFTMLYLMTGGGPSAASETVIIRIYRVAFEYFDINYASTMGTVVLLVLLGITILYFKITQGKVE